MLRTFNELLPDKCMALEEIKFTVIEIAFP